jgi:hypothetical protein
MPSQIGTLRCCCRTFVCDGIASVTENDITSQLLYILKTMSLTNDNSRLEAFCDGVFAIALTLLIIDIKLPRGS